MFKSIKTIILIIIFIFLAAIASIAFSNSEKGEKEKSKLNSITVNALNFINSGADNLENFSFIKKVDEYKDINKPNFEEFKITNLKTDFQEKLNNLNNFDLKNLWQEKMGLIEKDVDFKLSEEDLQIQKNNLEEFLSNIENQN